MRRASLILATGATMIAPAALAHPGDHHAVESTHFLIQHGIAAALVAAAIIAGAAVLYKRKG